MVGRPPVPEPVKYAFDVSVHRKRMAFADALRAAAIALVVFWHLASFTRPTLNGHFNAPGYLGFYGVNCFFVLSGFLLAGPFLMAILDPNIAFPSVKLFLLRRFLRIYPLYAFAVVVSAVIVAVSRTDFPSAHDIWMCLLFLQDFSTGPAFKINNPLWTMPVDGVYLALPLVAFFLVTLARPIGSRGRLIALFATLAIIVTLSLVYRYVESRHNPLAMISFQNQVVFIRNGIGMAGSFTFGVGMALIALIMERRPKPKRAVYSGCLALAAVLAVIIAREPLRLLAKGKVVTTVDVTRATFLDLLAGLSVALIIFSLAEGQFPKFTAISNSKIVRSGAALAYSAYLFHYPIIQTVEKSLGSPRGNKALIEVGGIALPVILAMAYVTHRYLEAPLLALKDRQRDTVARAVRSAPAERCVLESE